MRRRETEGTILKAQAGRIAAAGLQIDAELHEFVRTQVLPGLDVDEEALWSGLAVLIAETAPRIAETLATRVELQEQIDGWHRARVNETHDSDAYRAFLQEIGYIVPVGGDFAIDTENVDPEISNTAGPQLVVPVSNARYALNAANARWGSLYDAIYGTDVLGSSAPDGAYDADRGTEVVAWVRGFLDDIFPLQQGSHADAVAYRMTADGTLGVHLANASVTTVACDPSLIGYTGDPESPSSVLLVNHGLGVVLEIDRDHPIGSTDAAGIKDVVIESAVTTIVDFEDSVAAVDASDKVAAYATWLGLMRGDLSTWVAKRDTGFTRRLAPNRAFLTHHGAQIVKRGRALLLVRNVGHLMTTDAVLDPSGGEVPETLLDAMLTVLIAMHDFQRPPAERNSPAGSVYVVKPKLHGPAEVALTDDIFTSVERALGLEPNTVKIGVMDEERRTTLNLKECIRAARHRIAFINTGFLDRTGDEIHTSMEAGPMVRKAEMRGTRWITAYEDLNVDTALACGLRGRAQIGKGMWAAPDHMAEMLEEKIGHPRSGASTAWVPSPTAATLHATHYHRVDVGARQRALEGQPPRATLEDLLTFPAAADVNCDRDARLAEIDNNAQGILGYVVRWVNQGIGCSKVPDINNVGLMEDRATCRISSQHMANWLRHGVISQDDVNRSLRQMAAIVDRQNAGDPNYEPMGPGFDGEAYLAASALVFEGARQPSGYTEPILHRARTHHKLKQNDPVATMPLRTTQSDAAPDGIAVNRVIEAKHFRHVLSHVPTSVVVVTGVSPTGAKAGMVVGTFTSISLDPPLVGFFPTHSSTSWPPIREAGRFCVNVLAQGQTEMASRFAQKGGDKFDGITTSPAPFSRAPVLNEIVAWIDCELHMELEIGDHFLVVGRVIDLGVTHSDHPLVFSRGTYPLLTPVLVE
jgi:malate synthase